MSDHLAARLGDALRHVREGVGVSQAELARRIQVKQSYLTEWEGGRKTIPLTRIEEIDRALGVPLGSVLAQAGFVEPAVFTRKELAENEELDEFDRQYIANWFDLARQRHARSRGDGVA